MTIHAIYENGVFKPKEPVELPDGCEVKVEPLQTEALEVEESLRDREHRELLNRSEEEIEEDRRRIRSLGRPGRPLPPGVTLADVWPEPVRGDETEEEVRAALERLS